MWLRWECVVAREGFDVNRVGFGEVAVVVSGWVAMVLDEEGL